MDDQAFVLSSNLVERNCGKLYLNEKTADVFFVFYAGTAHSIRVPAHRTILAAGSVVFETMFYDSPTANRDIPIVDASVTAFQEFLQFFYKNRITLTSSRIIEVANLSKTYQLFDELNACEDLLIHSLSINNNWCTGYGAAVSLELSRAVEFCENFIEENPTAILTSDNFLQGNRRLFERIFHLVRSNCNASVLINACMAWAKAECRRKCLDETPINLRYHLRNTIDLFPFDKLHAEQFNQFTAAYSGFIDRNTLESIIFKVIEQKSQLLDLLLSN